MPVELSIVESVTELETTVVQVVLESASAPGPAGPGVPAGGTAGQVPVKQSGTDYDIDWEDQSGGGVTDADYLVGTAHAGLSAEIVVGTSPGGELGGTWASPTVDATHSGSSHAAVQAAAEATAAAALASHETDQSNVHGIADTTALALTANHPSNATFNDHSARHENGGADEISIAGLDGTPTELANHLADAADAHDASAISVADAGTFYTATDVEGVLQEIAPQLGGASNLADLDDVTGTPDAGEAPVWDGDSFELTNIATQAELDAHTGDTSDAHDASAISVADSGGLFTATDVEAALAELKNTAPGKEIGYAQITADQTISDTTSPGDPVVSLGAITFDGTPVMIEFFCVVDTGATDNSEVFFELFDDTTNLIRIANVMTRVAESQRFTVFAKYRLTPTAASHTYNIKAVRVASNGTIKATPAFPPCFLRAVRV